MQEGHIGVANVMAVSVREVVGHDALNGFVVDVHFYVANKTSRGSISSINVNDEINGGSYHVLVDSVFLPIKCRLYFSIDHYMKACSRKLRIGISNPQQR